MKYRADKSDRVQRKLASGQKCPYCKRTMTSEYGVLDGRSPTRDHVITQGRGGGDHPENMMWCCRRCNNLRGSVPFEVFLAFSRYVLVSHADLSDTLLRNALREFVYWLAHAALGKRDAINHAVRMGLLRMAADMEK